MPTNVIVTSTSTLTTSIPTPDDGEGATGAGLDGFVQPLLNNDAYLAAIVASTGVKIVRTVASLADLNAMTSMTHNEICLLSDASVGAHLYVYHSLASIPGDDVLIVTPGSGVGTWLSSLAFVGGIANGVALYNSSGKLGLGKVVNQIFEVSSGALGANFNNTTTTYATGHSKTASVSVAAGDRVTIHAHANLTAAVGAGVCFARIAVSENGGSDIPLTETEDLFDDTTVHRRAYTTVRTVGTGGIFQARWQVRSGVAGKAATLATPAAITLQVVRP